MPDRITTLFAAGACLWILATLIVLGGTAESSSRHSPADNSQDAAFNRLKSHVTNARFLGSGFYCGAQPRDEQAMRLLSELGIRTVVSVDGARPDVLTAKRHALRYVHIPIGYDGISKHATNSLVQLVRSAPRPIYIHCHHGKHRGPAAAAIVWIASGDCNVQAALQMMRDAGTSRSYSGLWRDVADFEMPSPEVALPSLVETADVDSLTAAMASIDRAYDRLQLGRDTNWTTPVDHPDVVPQREALLLVEGFHEAARSIQDRARPSEKDKQLVASLKQTQALANQLRANLVDNHDIAGADRRLFQISKACHECHEQHRN